VPADGVIDFVGAGPAWCAPDDAFVCRWYAVRRTPGYIRLAPIANAAGKKLAAVCRFGIGESAAGEPPCSVEVSAAAPGEWRR
jgi:hypothetical protein